MKQFLLIICGIALLASCGKLGVTTYTVVNETDDEVFNMTRMEVILELI